MNINLKQQLGVMASIAILAVSSLSVIGYLTNKHSSIGSENYNKIIYANELTADILPPPMYLVELMLKVEQLSQPDSNDQQLLLDIDALLADYSERFKRWSSTSDLDSSLTDFIQNDLNSITEQLIDEIKTELIPAVRKADAEAVTKAKHNARVLFSQHKATLGKLVTKANNYALKEAKDGAGAADSYQATFYFIVVTSIIIVLISSFMISRKILGTLGVDPNELRIIANEVSKGNADVVLPENKNPDSVLGAMERMVGFVNKSLSEKNAAIRVTQALNSSSTNLMIADADRNIIYMNSSVEAMLRRVEDDLKKALPHFSVNSVIGSNMDIFHKDPSHQRELLANLTTTYVGNIIIAGLSFRLVANPIFAESGERLGSVVEWLDRTQEVFIEGEINTVVEAAVDGDFTARVSTNEKEGFFLKLAESLNELLSNTENGLGDISRVLESIAKGDLTETVEASYKGVFDDLKNSCNETSQNLASMLTQIREAAETINTASAEISQGNTDLSSRTEQQASSLEETASSMEELTGTVRQNADNAKQANALAAKASEVAVNGGDLIDQVVVTMASINESSQKISDIIGVIDGIAFQTNILALNAAVEAARAGEQGRGFAVVASEVRTLAQRSANAAKDIKGLISDSVGKINNGNELVSKSGDTMKEIVLSIKRVNDIMSEIAAASAEQASGLDEVGKAVNQMDEMTQQNAALVEEAAAASESLLSQAEQLARHVSAFKLISGGQDTRQLESSERSRSRTPHLTAPEKRTRSSNKTIKPAKPLDDEWESF